MFKNRLEVDSPGTLPGMVMSASFEGETTQNASIERKDASIHGKDELLKTLYQAGSTGKMSQKAVLDVQKIIEQTDIMQVITSKEIMRILSCKTTKARLILKIMDEKNLVKPVQGKGKGKYILNIQTTL